MPPAMTDLLDIWAAHSPLAGHAPDQITVDFLLPTGIYIQMDVPREATVQHIKLLLPLSMQIAHDIMCDCSEFCEADVKSHRPTGLFRSPSPLEIGSLLRFRDFLDCRHTEVARENGNTCAVKSDSAAITATSAPSTEERVTA
ncbi:Phosphatidylinositol 4,5-bisphosphate 3-kinase catalytic subunit beta isoform [Liparis tanakae]|uniref:Phosphatidylinositol 4,5-bisphosphate 3-kinase catalytic subunit beta isoform n=1 Tax=Liparis tanakae TaxID=230148 RepID=A0A4Z2EEB5_9TELE|nr:Phosphatidylinositol 4,5-bisphosphate 3-kinase catalytic subunit beta isoform [Liparis tanakae]